MPNKPKTGDKYVIEIEGVDGDGDICDGLVSDVEPTGRKVPGAIEAMAFLRDTIEWTE